MIPTQARHLLSLAFCGAGCMQLAAQSATVRGFVRDERGAAVAGASVKLTCEAVPARSARTSTAQDGGYRITALLPCEYRLSGEFAGALSSPLAVAVTAADDSVHDLVLSPNLAVQEKPKFAASGIRGLIDPGGYSAPANAAAATGVLSGMAALQRGRDAEHPRVDCGAEVELQRTIAQQPASPLAKRRLGELYLEREDYAKALPLLQVAGQSDTDDTSTHLDVAEALLGLQRFAEARAQLESLPDDPGNARLHRLLARADEGSGQFRQASAEYLHLSESEPSDKNSFGAGYEAILDGRPADAEAIFREGLLRYPRSVTLLIGEGAATFLEGKAAASIEAFLAAADLDPTDTRPYPFLAAAFATSTAEAERVLATTARHARLAPADSEGLLAYASMLEKVDKPNTAGAVQNLLQQAITLQPDLVQAYFDLGVLEAREGENAKAISAFKEVLQLDPSRTEAHYRLSLILRKNGQSAEAERELKLFQGDRTHDGAAGSADLRQFLSVMQSARPERHTNACPGLIPPA